MVLAFSFLGLPSVFSPRFFSLLACFSPSQKKEIKALRAEGKATLAKVNKAGGDISVVDESMESLRGLEHGLSVCDPLYDQEVVTASSRSSLLLLLSDADCAAAAVSLECPLGRSQRRKNIVTTILTQQREQKESGIDDAKGLQVTATACTQWARDRAVDQAQKDFDDAVQVWKEDAACASLLSSILNSKQKTTKKKPRRSSSLVAAPSDAEQRRMTLDSISATLATALEELEDLDF